MIKENYKMLGILLLFVTKLEILSKYFLKNQLNASGSKEADNVSKTNMRTCPTLCLNFSFEKSFKIKQFTSSQISTTSGVDTEPLISALQFYNRVTRLLKSIFSSLVSCEKNLWQRFLRAGGRGTDGGEGA